MRNSRRAMMLGIAVLAGILTLGLGNAALAFHAGGVAHCDGCHSMHNSPDNPVTGTTNNKLLKGSDASSTCLNCHAAAGRSYNVMSSDGSSFTPGGDFFWLTTSYNYTVRGTPYTSEPDNTGHNVIATDFGLTADASNSQAPGGIFPGNSLTCISCHSPHGQVAGGGTAAGQLPISVSGSYGAAPAAGTIAGNYRLLKDLGSATAPVAVTAGFGETDASHPAYGQDMGEWCAACHGQYINDNHKHPASNSDTLNGKSTNYNAYVNTGDYTGVQGTSFLQFVQFERQETNTATLLAGVTSTAGPDSADNVMCLSCHRAHASAFNNATRWDTEEEFLADSLPGAQQLSDMGAIANAAYYGRDVVSEFGQYQRSLCNKCHVKD